MMLSCREATSGKVASVISTRGCFVGAWTDLKRYIASE